MTRTILVVGGFGTIGGRLGELLAARGDHVVLAGRRVPEWFRPSERLRGHVLDVTQGDLTDSVRSADAVVHLAAMNDRACRADPEGAKLVNVEGTRRLLDAARRNGVERFVYLSTAQIYGSPYQGHLTESTAPAPTSVYAATHLEAEELVAAEHTANSLVGIRLRLSNGFGVPSHPDNEIWQVVINDLVRTAIASGTMTLRGSGRERRNFIPFSSVRRGIMHCLDLKDPGAGLFNLGSAVSSTTREMTDLIANRVEISTGRRPDLVSLNTASEQIADLHFDCSALAATGFHLDSDPTSEIDELIEFCQRTFVSS